MCKVSPHTFRAAVLQEPFCDCLSSIFKQPIKKKKANTPQPAKAAHSDPCQSEAKSCSLSELSPASANAQLYYPFTHQVHSNHYTMKKTDRTQAIDNMAGSCLSLLLGYSCSRPSLPFFCHCVATNTPFCQRSNCTKNPWASGACHCSGFLHSAGNNKKGSLFWTDESGGALSLVWPVSQTSDAEWGGQVIVGQMKLFCWDKHKLVASAGTLSDVCSRFEFKNCRNVSGFRSSFPSKMRRVNLQYTYLPTETKFLSEPPLKQEKIAFGSHASGVCPVPWLSFFTAAANCLMCVFWASSPDDH